MSATEFHSRWLDWNPETPNLPTAKTDKTPNKDQKRGFVSFGSTSDRDPSRLSGRDLLPSEGLCQRCRHLIASGVRVLACSCGYLAPRREVKLSAHRLRYPIDYVRENLPTLSTECREYFDYWLEYALAAGHDQETAERATFARMVDDVLAPKKHP